MKLKHICGNRELQLVGVFVAGTLLLFGCRKEQSQSETKKAELKTFFQEEDNLFAPYMTGNVEQARQSLNATIQFLKNGSNVLNAHAQSGDIFIEYARLYALEKRVGNEADAETALIKARYWRIRGMQPPESTDDSAILFKMTNQLEGIIKGVDELDAGGSKATPNYLQYITNSPTGSKSIN